MPEDKIFPIGNQTITNASELGALIRRTRTEQGLTQKDIAGLGNTGNRLIVELENGKPTVQLQKVLDIVGLLGLEVRISRKGQP